MCNVFTYSSEIPGPPKNLSIAKPIEKNNSKVQSSRAKYVSMTITYGQDLVMIRLREGLLGALLNVCKIFSELSFNFSADAQNKSGLPSRVIALP